MERVSPSRASANAFRCGNSARRPALLMAATLAASGGVAACSLSQEGVMPPADTFFFPSSAVASPDGQWLYVANSNADLRYNDGTLDLVNVGLDTKTATSAGIVTLRGAASDRARGGTWPVCPQEDYVHPLPRTDPPTCCWDVLDSNILNCDERLYVQSDATVRIGSFAAGMVWQDSCTDPCPHGSCTVPSGAGRLILGVRGNTSLTWIDVLPPGPLPRPGLYCRDDDAEGGLSECTRTVTETTSALTSEAQDQNAPAVNLPDEPYALALDPTVGLLYVGHLVGNVSVPDSGGISLFDVSGTASGVPGFSPPPRFVAPFSSPFAANGNGSVGVTTLNLHPPLGGGSANELFVSSRYVPSVASMVPFLAGDPSKSFTCTQSSDLVVVPSSDTLSSGLVGSEMRGVAFVDPVNGDATQRVFALQRVPPSLISFDVNQKESGAQTVQPSTFIETCSGPSFLYKYQNQPSDPARLYVNCFDTGEIYVFDPAIPSLITTLQVGRGPAGMVFDQNLRVAYVLDFSQNDIVVVDLAPDSPTEDHVIQRIGFPSTTPR